ncbi:MAG: phenylalanine--tRNA ligase subunit beta [Saprospiraceae bacterium]|nr:phenylalanine--tRNA ligase subunit beta [Saprospiraceae bacterium]
MRLSLNWLKRYLDLDLTPEKIAEILTTIGLEVEGIEEIETVKGGLKGVVTGLVKECNPHPDADKLSLTLVDIGQEELLQIVCGAPNVAAGQKVFVATIGTSLYIAEGEEWKIKKSKIRGAESFGMICSEAELGLSADHSGIKILPEETTLGEPAAKILQLENDIVFEIGLTPNRSDATSQLGVARDLLAYLKTNEGYSDDLREPDLSAFVSRKVPFSIQSEVLNKTACPRYSAAVIHNIEVKESPVWLKNLLHSVGVRPINNIVDITNFVLHELGQPLHAFDADKIKNSTVNVSTLPEGTVFTGLDNIERKLSAEDLMICDGDMKPMCMAGVFGGAGTGVTSETKNLFLESAYFDPKTIRRTSTRHNLRTDAARIYEKGGDPNITEYALKRASVLIADLAGGTVGNIITDHYPKRINPAEILLRYSTVVKLMGVAISREDIHQILQAMDMEISPVDDSSILVKVPTNKPDVTREVDLIEEIVRIYGLNKIPVSDSIKSNISYTTKPEKKEILEMLSDFLASRGFNEMMGLSLIESAYYEEKTKEAENNLVYINNTSNIHLDIMRPDMLISGLTSVAYNLNRQQSNLNLFENGKTYQKSGDNFSEQEFLTIFKTGKKEDESWLRMSDKNADFYDVKNIIISVLKKAGIQDYTETEITGSNRFKYGITILKGETILAELGEVTKEICQKAGIKSKVFYAEIPVTNLLKKLKGQAVKVSEISRFPQVRRDLALIVNKEVRFNTIEQLAFQTDKKLLKQVNLFDVYENETQLGNEKKSCAVSFIFESTEKTLQDVDVDVIMQKLIKKYEESISAIIRK